MPFTNPWSDTVPPGSTAAKLIDDHIRRLRLDLRERMEQALIVDWAGDPLVIRPELKGGKDDKKLIIPFAAFANYSDGVNNPSVLMQANYLTAFVRTSPLVAPVIIPRGSDAGPILITLVEFMVERGDAASLTLDFRRRPFANGEARDFSQVLASTTHVGTPGPQIVALPGISIGVAGADINMFYLTIDATGADGNAFHVFGARITYNCPDARATY